VTYDEYEAEKLIRKFIEGVTAYILAGGIIL
jgi:hypothetical protein